MEAGPIHVALVEDDDEIRANLAYRIDGHPHFRLTGSYGDAESALAEIPRQKPQVVLMDINLPGMDGVECVRRLKLQLATTRFVMLTVYEDSNRLFKSLMAGASGYLLKRSSSAKLLTAIHEAHEGGSPMTPQIARLMMRHFQEASQPAVEIGKLTAREREVLEQLSKGFRYQGIIDNMVISERTLHSHIRNIYEKLHVHSRKDGAVKYLRP
jgi:DNA-binding NarL/FixJ family response regulator